MVKSADGRYGMVQAIVVLAQPQVMYNLTVHGDHTFFVGAGEWLVHNDSCIKITTNSGGVVTHVDGIPNNPADSPGSDWTWRGQPPEGGDKGAWYNPSTGESLHPNLNHPFPEGPHWDYVALNGVAVPK
jgi:hypothetical protein